MDGCTKNTWMVIVYLKEQQKETEQEVVAVEHLKECGGLSLF